MISPKTIIVSTFVLFISFFGQTQMTENDVREMATKIDESELLEKNNRFLIEGDIFFADIIASKLVEKKPESSNYNYRKGFSLLELSKAYEKAIPYFEKAILNVNNNYDMFSTREKSAPSDAYFYLAKCYHLDENIDKAEIYYQKFIDNSRKKSELLSQAKLQLKQCAVARTLYSNPQDITLKNLGGDMNTDAAEYSPVVSLDGSALYFTSRRGWSGQLGENVRETKYNQYGEDIYVSYRDFDMNWTKPDRLAFCEPQRNEATISVSTDERRILLYLDNVNNGDIYFTDFYAAKFNDIEPIGIDGVNSEYWETHCMMSHDNLKLFFVSNRLKGGYGGRDIYYCDKQEDGSWSKPKNMGPQINSEFDEDAPFISVDNMTLYFASNGDKSMGGFDILKSSLQADGTWSEGVNLGHPFNSTNDDLYYTTTIDGLLGYMTSDREGGFGEKDIYEIQNEFLGIENIAVLKGIINTPNEEVLAEDVDLKMIVNCPECKSNKVRIVYPRLRDGFFLSSLEPCKTYTVNYLDLKKQNTLYTDSFTTDCDTSYQEIFREFMLNEDGTLSVYDPIVLVDSALVDVPDDIIAVVDEIKDDITPVVDPIIEDIVIVEDSIDVVVDDVIAPDVVIDDSTPIQFNDLAFKKYLGFNEDELSISNSELKLFLANIEKQITAGREGITIQIYSSASMVPTKTFSSNKELAKSRAENTKDLLMSYLQTRPTLIDQVTVEISAFAVRGPQYKGDLNNEEKYGRYQYVRLKTK